MKKIVLLALIITSIIAVSVLIGGYVASKDDTATSPSTDNITNQTSIQTDTTQNQSAQLYTSVQVSQHATDSDCWIIISNTVYNVTNFLSQHPGGADRIIPYCGKDATEAFNTQDGEGSHSSTATNMLQNYKVGSLSN